MPDEIDHIADLQRRLYSRDPDNIPKRKYGILHPNREKTKSTWGQTELTKERRQHKRDVTSYKRFFIFTLVFFLIGVCAALFSFYRGAITVSSKNVDLVILGNSFVAGGEELPIQIEVVNKNSTDLINAELLINYPKGATDESGADIMRVERSLGTVSSGKTKSEELVVVLYGEQGVSREITATLTYKLEGSTAVFEKESVFSVMVSSSPVGLEVTAPTAIVSGQPFSLSIRNTFTGDKMLNNVITRVEYPNGFVYQSATPEPTSANNVWSIGDMQKGDERIININGKIVGEENDQKAFRTYVGVPENEMSNLIAVNYNSKLSTMVISQPFISGVISVANSTEDIIALRIGEVVEGAVSWVNNSNNSITNPRFTLSLKGEHIDYSSIEAPNSYYDKLEKTITWVPQSSPSLHSISPGQRGILPFKFTTINPTQGGKGDITLGLSIAGVFPELNNQVQSIKTIDEKIVRFISNLQFTGQALYSIGPFQNTGPYPPKADTDTTYTISWTVVPSENPLSNVMATATLPLAVSWNNKILPESETVVYNPTNKTVTWNIGHLPRATDIPKSRTMSFQITAKPTASYIGNNIELLGATTITATDTVTNTPISITKPPLTTELTSDPVYTQGKDRVLP